MNRFSISDMVTYSGLKAVTIRAWETRYGALSPTRSEGNTRYYSSQQLRRLLNIATLVQAKDKVSEVCTLTDQELFKRVWDKESALFNKDTESFILQLIGSSLTYDETQFTRVLDRALETLGWKDTYQKVIYPLLGRIGVLWQCDTLGVAHEHFISNLLRQKISAAIDGLPAGTGETWLMCLPEGEHHEIGLLIAHYLVRLAGKRSVYLGADVPIPAIAQAVADISPDNVLLFTVGSGIARFSDELETIERTQPEIKFYIAGDPSKNKTGIAGVRWLGSLEALLAALA